MPRTNVGSHAWRRLLTADLFVPQPTSPGDTVTTAPVLGDGTEPTIAVAATTGFLINDFAFNLGEQHTELFKLGTPATAMPVTYKPKYAAATGARFLEAIKITLGKILEDGFILTPSKSLTPVPTSTDDFPAFYIDGPIELQGQLSLLEYTGKNIQLMLGYADAETGAGTAADPYQVVIGAVNQALLSTAVLRIGGQLQNANYLQIDMVDVRFEASAAISHSRKVPPAAIPISIKCGGGLWREATAQFTNN